MIHACAKNRILGFTTLEEVSTRPTVCVHLRDMRMIFLWLVRCRFCRWYQVGYFGYLDAVGEASIPRRGRRKDRTNRRSAAGMIQAAHLNPLQRPDIGSRADKQFNGWAGITCWMKEKYPTRAGPLFLLLCCCSLRPEEAWRAGRARFKLQGRRSRLEIDSGLPWASLGACSEE